MLDGMSDSIQRSSIENLHSREVDRQSPTGLIFLHNMYISNQAITMQATISLGLYEAGNKSFKFIISTNRVSLSNFTIMRSKFVKNIQVTRPLI